MTFFSSSPSEAKAKWMSHSTSIWSLVTSINGAALIDLLQRFTDPLTHRKVTVGVFSKWFTRNQGERGQEYSSDSLVGELTDKMWLHDSEDNNKDNENNNDGTAKPGGARVQFWFIGWIVNWQDVIARQRRQQRRQWRWQRKQQQRHSETRGGKSTVLIYWSES